MRALVIGYGRMGRFHRRALADLGYDVTTVDPAPEAGADRLSVPMSRAFDVVCVAAPIQHLAEQAAAWAGKTDRLLIEKPMAASAREAGELRRALVGQPTCVGYVERFNPRVRELNARKIAFGPVQSATFTRWNDRPSVDVDIDLTSHDIDLARFLGISSPRFCSRAEAPVRLRSIDLHCALGTVSADLMDHNTSPLHAQWHAFLSRRPGYATPADAVAVLLALSGQTRAVAA